MAAHDLPTAPSAEVVDRYRRAVVAGHEQNAATIRGLIEDEAAIVRQAALAALVRSGLASAEDLTRAFNDPDPVVRSRAAELAIVVDGCYPSPLLVDDDASVVEVACFSCGEIDWSRSGVPSPPLKALASVATSHEDPLCRESAAAALGAIGDPAGLEAVLHACTDRVTVRRRAMLALAAFDDPRAESMLRSALDDKDWQVRQAAEDLLEVGRLLDAPEDPDAYAD